MKPRTCLPLAAALSLFISALDAADLIGAAGVLQRIQTQAAEGQTALNPLDVLRQRLADYDRAAPTLPPEAAALRWVELHDEYARLPSSSRYSQDYQNRIDLSRLLQSLPPAPAWDALSALLLARTENAATYNALAQRLLGHLLNGDLAGQRETCARMIAKLGADKKLESYKLENLNENLVRLSDAINAASGDGDRLAGFERELARQEQAAAQGEGHADRYLSVPDLVAIGGPEAAAPLLRRVIVLGAQPNIDGKRTRALYKEIVLADIATLPRPAWSFVDGIEDLALYEALVKKFPEEPQGRDHAREAAWSVYVAGLVANDQPDEAVRQLLAKSGNLAQGQSYQIGSALNQLERAGRGDAVAEFMRKVLEADPVIDLWGAYIQLSARRSESADALGLLRAAIARPDQPAPVKSRLQSHLADALLAADEIDEGVALLLNVVRADTKAPVKETAGGTELPSLAELAQMGVELTPDLLKAFAEAQAELGGNDDGAGQAAILSLLKIARLLERPDLTETALAAGLARLGQADAESRLDALQREVIDALVRLDRADEAEALLVKALTRARATERSTYRHASQSVALELAGLYGRLGRHEDVLRLFDGYPDWMADDLADFGVRAGGHYSTGEPRPYQLVADALIATGREAEAVPVLRRMIVRQPGSDDGYERLEKLEDPGYAALLDKAARIDRFQERPLIWKARLQLKEGHLEEAEKTVRAAIAIDPSDGEQGKGDRMRAYAVLADILEKRGDAEQAAIMRGAVAAIRLSEQADDWWNAGLLTRAVRLYEEALEKFADAYCIQSRLALRYSELGDDANAEKHYRRAFELMPSSFGRIESHCFGCEGAFNGEVAQNAAERVFSRLAETMPDRAQVFYLLGYLRDSQERPAESVGFYRKAVEIDPDYLNAWQRLQTAGEATGMSAAERETIALAILRLDPAGLHASPRADAFVDLKRLWTVILQAEGGLPPYETGPVHRFSAAAAHRETLRQAGGDTQSSGRWENTPPNLRKKLTEVDRIGQLTRLLEPDSF
ncbi:MAG: hypothetical protein ABII82_16875 [Verrucomicrobiota bacterium]